MKKQDKSLGGGRMAAVVMQRIGGLPPQPICTLLEPFYMHSWGGRNMLFILDSHFSTLDWKIWNKNTENFTFNYLSQSQHQDLNVSISVCRVQIEMSNVLGTHYGEPPSIKKKKNSRINWSDGRPSHASLEAGQPQKRSNVPSPWRRLNLIHPLWGKWRHSYFFWT